jgi:hypothetical protein
MIDGTDLGVWSEKLVGERSGKEGVARAGRGDGCPSRFGL